ncbi:amidohydrolase [Youxingia wuxianensis]|uniref:Amidohydrolase family protein n=1 Tax=Youxingia wuxianensis TaxID=2763678 RepID=A0A926EPH7_9FIRM|nr:amidohydrolase family protein [Youxingia wuxianensis]MBC8586391.1 amidohydrolase family protein [Youxingia wuxianensis]
MTSKKQADILLVSNNIFAGKYGEDKPFPGIVAIVDNKIAAVGDIAQRDEWIGEDTEVYELGDKVVCPGFSDNHVFFTGYVWKRIGADLSGANTPAEAAKILESFAKTLPDDKPVYGHGLNVDGWSDADKDAAILDKIFGARAVIAYTPDRDFCWLNKAAQERYQITADECWAEVSWRLFKEYLSDKKFAAREYKIFSDLLASRGVTSIKEIGFDTYFGFADILEDFEKKGQLKHRINLVSQPVGAPMNYEYGEECKKRFDSDFIRFMGYNVMVDGEICTQTAAMIEPYEGKGDWKGDEVDYASIEKAVLEADKRGMRCALHAEGDAAVRGAVDIFEKCQKVNGKRDSRHAIIDLEMTHPEDLKRMGELGISAINYFQIIQTNDGFDGFYGEECVGKQRLSNYWAYKRMLESGVNVCVGTDLPLSEPDIPLSLYFTVARKFLDGKPEGGFNKEQGITVAQTLRAWSAGGAYVNFMDKKLGTLEEGKLADIVVFDGDVFTAPIDEVPQIKVEMTICDGRLVYSK